MSYEKLAIVYDKNCEVDRMTRELFAELQAEIARLRLTDAEREVVLELVHDLEFYGLTRNHVKVLRGLFSRLAETSTPPDSRR